MVFCRSREEVLSGVGDGGEQQLITSSRTCSIARPSRVVRVDVCRMGLQVFEGWISDLTTMVARSTTQIPGVDS